MLILEEPSPLPVHTLAFSPDGLTLASVNGRSRNVILWDLQSRQPRANLTFHYHRVVSVAFAPSGDVLATVSSAGEVHIWDAPGWALRFLHQFLPREGSHAPGRLAFSPDGRLLATNFFARQAQLLPLQFRNHLHASRPAWHYGSPWWVYPLQILRLADRTVQPFFSVRSNEISSLAFSPDGQWLATGGFDRAVHVQQINGAERMVLNQGQKVHFLAYSPDGRTLASGTPQGLVKIWDATTGSKRTTLKGQSRPLHALCYSPDGKIVITAGGEGTVTFWDVTTGKSQTAFDWGIGEVHSVAFAPDGMRAAAGGLGRIIVWDIDWDF